jgi:hypothetical protein
VLGWSWTGGPHRRSGEAALRLLVWLKTVARGVELGGDLGDGGGDGGRREQLWTTVIGRGLWFDYRQGPARLPTDGVVTSGDEACDSVPESHGWMAQLRVVAPRHRLRATAGGRGRARRAPHRIAEALFERS